MDRQLGLNLASEQERVESVVSYLQPIELAQRQIAALALIMGCGEAIQVLGQHARRWVADKATISEKARKYGLKCSGNTFLAAVSELEDRRIVGVLRNTRPWTYAVSLAALERVEKRRQDPLEALTALACFGGLEGGDRDESRSGPVRSGQAARVRERVDTQNPCPTVYRGSVDVSTGGGGLADRLRRPWDRQSGLTDADLTRAVESGDLEPVRALWREAQVLEWVGVGGDVSDDDTLRFLTIVHHAATSKGINQSRFGVLVNRVRRGLDVSKIPQVSERWAAGVLAARHRVAEVGG